MSTASLVLGIIAGISATVQVGLTALKRIREARQIRGARAERMAKLSSTIRQTARKSLAAKREIRKLTNEIAQMQRANFEQAEEVSRMEAEERRIHVLDDRKTANDQPFMLTITHPTFDRLMPEAPPEMVASWRSGRRYLVWAVDAEKAATKVSVRFPSPRGYQLGKIEPSPLTEQDFLKRG